MVRGVVAIWWYFNSPFWKISAWYGSNRCMVFDVFVVDSPSGYNLGEINRYCAEYSTGTGMCTNNEHVYYKKTTQDRVLWQPFWIFNGHVWFFVVVCLFVCCCCCCAVLLLLLLLLSCCCSCCCLRMFQYMWYFYTSCWKPIFANIKKYWKSTDSVLGFVVLGGKIIIAKC